jgi:hypothetical protein
MYRSDDGGEVCSLCGFDVDDHDMRQHPPACPPRAIGFLSGEDWTGDRWLHALAGGRALRWTLNGHEAHEVESIIGSRRRASAVVYGPRHGEKLPPWM